MKKVLIGLIFSLVLLPFSASAELVSYWSFDNSANPGKDYVGVNHGIVYGATWTEDGVKNGALIFDGVDDYVVVLHDDSLDVTDELTVEVWLNISNDTTIDMVVAKATTGNGFYFYVETARAKALYFMTENATNVSSISTDYNPYYGDWHHAVGVFNGTNEILYIDGEKKRDQTPTINQINPSTSWLGIGRSTTGTGGWTNRLNGTIDELKIYNRALSAEEVLEHYNEVIGNYSEADLNEDGIVDILDLATVSIHFGQTETHQDWNVTADVIEDGEIDIYDIVFETSRLAEADTIPPQVTSFDIQPRNTTLSISASWGVRDNQALKRVELWRTNDDNGQPDEGNWALVPGKVQSISGTMAFGQFTDTPPDGSFWYRVNVIDNTDHTDYAEPINVIKDASAPGNVFLAASLRYVDIQNAVNFASPGDTVMLPEGTNNDWSGSDTVVIDKPLEIRGQGPDKTIIKLSSTNEVGSKTIFQFLQVSGNLSFTGIRLEGLNDPNYADRGLSISGSDNSTVRIWNCEFFGLMANSVSITGYPLKGVMWNCTIKNSHYNGLGYCTYVGGNQVGDAIPGDASFNDPVDLGGPNNFFIEDNYYENCRHMVDGSQGARNVVRYNTIIATDPNPISNAVFNQHSWGNPVGPAPELHGHRSYEYYKNVIDSSSNGKYPFMIGQPDGVIWGNEIIGYGASDPQNNWCYMRHNCCGGSGGGEGCNGSYPETEQVSRLYIWNNTVNGQPAGEPYEIGNCRRAYEPDPPGLFDLDRDYFLYEMPGYTPYPYPHPLREGL